MSNFIEWVNAEYLFALLLCVCASLYGFYAIIQEIKEEDGNNGDGGIPASFNPKLDLPDGITTLDDPQAEKPRALVDA